MQRSRAINAVGAAMSALVLLVVLATKFQQGARYAIVEKGAVTFRRVAYDHRAAAAKAERDGRPDWALGLRTGRMEQIA